MSETDQETGEIVWRPVQPLAYGAFDPDLHSRESWLHFDAAQDMAQQQFKDDADINRIVERYGVTGELPADVKVPLPDEFYEVADFQSALNVVLEGERAFMEMPADVRRRFDNDPGKFLEFVHDDKNRDEARSLGLLVPEPKAPEPTLVKVVQDPPPAGAPGAGTSSST